MSQELHLESQVYVSRDSGRLGVIPVTLVDPDGVDTADSSDSWRSPNRNVSRALPLQRFIRHSSHFFCSKAIIESSSALCRHILSMTIFEEDQYFYLVFSVFF